MSFFRRNKNTIYFLFVAVVLLYFLYSVFPHNYWFDTRNDEFCFKYLEKGTLYGGQPQCGQGPVFYFLFYPLWLLFGNGFVYVAKFMIFLIFLGIIYLTYLIVNRETGKHYILQIFCLFFFTYIAFFTRDNKGMPDVLALFLFMVAVYILFYKNYKYNLFLAGLFFALILLTKFSFAVIILITFTYYFLKLFNVSFKERKLSYEFKRSNVMGMIYLGLPIILLYLLFLMIYPSLLQYTILAHIVLPGSTYLAAIASTIKMLFSFRIIYFVLLMLLLISLYILIYKPSFYSFVSFFGLIFMLITQNRINPGGFKFRYVAIVIPLFIIGVMKFYKEIETDKLYKLILFCFIAVLIYPGLKFTYLSKGVSDLDREINGLMEHIPKQELILTDENLALNYGVNIGNQHIISNVGYYDDWWGPRLEYLGKTNLTDWYNINWQIIFMDVINWGRYNAMFTGSNTNTADITILRAFLSEETLKQRGYELRLNLAEFLNFKKNFSVERIGIVYDVFDYKCSILIPNIRYKHPNSLHSGMLFMESQEDCDAYYDIQDIYLEKYFDSVCEKDEFFANELKRFSSKISDKKCEDGGELLFHYAEEDITKLDLFFILFFLSIFVLAYLYTIKYRNFKIIIIFILLAIVFLLIINTLLEDSYYRVSVEAKKSALQFVYKDSNLYKNCVYIPQPIYIGKLCDTQEDCANYINKYYDNKIKYMKDVCYFEDEESDCYTAMNTLPADKYELVKDVLCVGTE